MRVGFAIRLYAPVTTHSRAASWRFATALDPAVPIRKGQQRSSFVTDALGILFDTGKLGLLN
jgi:hypothetical protein